MAIFQIRPTGKILDSTLVKCEKLCKQNTELQCVQYDLDYSPISILVEGTQPVDPSTQEIPTHPHTLTLPMWVGVVLCGNDALHPAPGGPCNRLCNPQATGSTHTYQAQGMQPGLWGSDWWGPALPCSVCKHWIQYYRTHWE